MALTARQAAFQALRRIEHDGAFANLVLPRTLDGTIERVNPAVVSDPGLVNVAPYADAWLMELRPDDMQAALAGMSRGPQAIEALKAWIDKYELQCMRCTQ